MPKIRNVAFDCADPYTLALFWSKVMLQPISDDCSPDDHETAVVPPDGPRLYFQRVPEPRTVKNRLHVCLEPETTRDEEVARIVELGATVRHDRRQPDGTGWVVLADPEGNEFCVLRSTRERG